MTQTKLQPLKRSRAFIFNFMWNAGFLFSASAAVHHWSAVRCSLFGHFPSVFVQDRNSFQRLVQVCRCPRGLACRGVVTPACKHSSLEKWSRMSICTDMESLWSHELWQLCFSLILGSPLLHQKPRERCCDAQGLRMFIFEPHGQCLIFAPEPAWVCCVVDPHLLV